MLKAPSFWHRSESIAARCLGPLSWLYGLAGRLHRLLSFRTRVSVPVISVGNVVAGGAGKTPTVMTVVHLLHAAGFHPHILSRGYGARLAQPVRVDPQRHRAADVGDEALLLAACAPTWVHARREKSAKLAVAEGADVLICDDALQHYSLHKDISLLVIDGAYGLGNARVMPAGPLREPLKAALMRTDAVVFIGEDKQLLRPRIPLGIPIFHAEIQPVGDVSFLYEKPIIAFAGIARPEKFFASLAALHVTPLATHRFPDHHVFSESETKQLFAESTRAGARLVTTEKDWVRLTDAMRRHCHSLKIQLCFSKTQHVAQWLMERLYRCGAPPSHTA